MVPDPGRETCLWAFPGDSSSRRATGWMQRLPSAAPPGLGLAGGPAQALNGPSPPQNRGQLYPATTNRAVPSPEASSHSSRMKPTTPGARRSSESRGSHRPTPTRPPKRGTEAQGIREEKGNGREGGVTSGRHSSPRSGTFLGRGRERGGEWGREGKRVDSPGLLRARVLHRLATPGRRRTPERAWGRAQARLREGGHSAPHPAAASARGQIWRPVSYTQRREGGPVV